MSKITKSEDIGPVGVWNVKVYDADKKIIREKNYYNILPTVGRTSIVKQLAGTNTEEVEVTHIAVGTGSTAVANADTKMEFEVTRKAISSSNTSGTEASIAVFFNTTDIPAQTYTRFAAFGNGGDTASSISANSGVLYSHVETLETISATQTLTLTFKVSCNDGNA
jgi:hypothetical protein